VPLRALLAAAGTRWKVEEGFAGGKELTALDQHQVRTWTSRMRWTVLFMLAHAFLSVMTAAQRAPESGGMHHDQAGHELIPLTRNEIRRFFTGLLCRRHDPEHARHRRHLRHRFASLQRRPLEPFVWPANAVRRPRWLVLKGLRYERSCLAGGPGLPGSLAGSWFAVRAG